MRELSLRKGKALVVVAHPDDETIWMGGTMLKHPRINWTIFSLSRKDDPDRAPKFRKVAGYYKARGIISDLEDNGIMNIKASVPEIEKRLLSKIGKQHFTYLFTHDYNGEYGHPRHKGVHLALRKLIKEKKLSADEIFYFSYYLVPGKNFCVPNRKSPFRISLALNIFKAKQNVVEKLYGFKKDSFEYRSSAQIETFNQRN